MMASSVISLRRVSRVELFVVIVGPVSPSVVLVDATTGSVAIVAGCVKVRARRIEWHCSMIESGSTCRVNGKSYCTAADVGIVLYVISPSTA